MNSRPGDELVQNRASFSDVKDCTGADLLLPVPT